MLRLLESKRIKEAVVLHR